MRESPSNDAEDIVIEEVGSNSYGDMLYVFVGGTPDDPPPAMTAAELRNFAIFLVSTFKDRS